MLTPSAQRRLVVPSTLAVSLSLFMAGCGNPTSVPGLGGTDTSTVGASSPSLGGASDPSLGGMPDPAAGALTSDPSASAIAPEGDAAAPTGPDAAMTAEAGSSTVASAEAAEAAEAADPAQSLSEESDHGYSLQALAASTGKTYATASHTSGNFVAARSVDGNQATEWQSGAVTKPVLRLTLPASSKLVSLAIKTNPNVGTYTVETSADGKTWKVALTNQKNTTWTVETKTLPAGHVGNRVRLTFANGGKNVMVFEAKMNISGTVATPAPTPTAAPVTTPVTTKVKTTFGNQSVPKVGNSYTQGYGLMKDLGMNTIREGWNWKYIETANNQYVSWMNMFDGKMNEFKNMGVKTMVMITDTPDWASSDPKYASKTGFDSASLGKYTVPRGLKTPIFADGTDVYKAGVKPNPNNPFAEYVHFLATRYKGKVSYYQVWNEPDFPSGDLTAGTKDANGRTRYWTGSVQDYVRLLQVAHTIVKGIDPAAKVTTGGLGYESYLKAIIDNGGAKYFDVVDFHAYGTDKSSSNGVLNSAWGFLGRYNALKGVMAAKGVTGKTYSVSETGFTANNQNEQASYVAKVFATGAGLGDMETIQWAVFTNPGHNNIGLIDQSTLSVKTQGYHAYKFATSQLTGATATGKLTGTGVQGYSFKRRDGKPLYVVWSNTGSASTTIPVGAGQVLDKFG